MSDVPSLELFHYWTPPFQDFERRRGQVHISHGHDQYWQSFDEVYDGTLVGYSTEIYWILSHDSFWKRRNAAHG